MRRRLRCGWPVLLGLATAVAWSFGCSSATSPSCVYAVSPTTVSLPPAGGSGTVTVAAGRGCAWSASSGAGWLTITAGGAGSGDGTVVFSAPENGPSARSATLTVAGQTVTVSQDGVPAPTFELSGKVTDAFAGPALGIGGVLVTVSGGPSQGFATTDHGGTYAIPGLLTGVYTVTFVKSAYATGTATVTLSGPTSLPMSLLLDAPTPASTADLTGYWSGTGSYPNAPFRLVLVQTGSQFRGMYVDRLDSSSAVSGSYSSPEFTLRVDFGDAVLFLECAIKDAREINGVHRTSALGNRPYPFTMTR